MLHCEGGSDIQWLVLPVGLSTLNAAGTGFLEVYILFLFCCELFFFFYLTASTKKKKKIKKYKIKYKIHTKTNTKNQGVFWDILLFMVLLWHRHNLKRTGMWWVTVDSTDQSMDRLLRNRGLYTYDIYNIINVVGNC